MDRPDARAAMLAALRSRSAKLAEVLASDPDTLLALFRALSAEERERLGAKLRGVLGGEKG
jgi:hypothetical protein